MRRAVAAVLSVATAGTLAQSIHGRQATGGISNSNIGAPAISVEDVLLAADRMRSDRWYPEETEIGDSHAGRLNRAADMDMLMLAVKHPSPSLRIIGLQELGRFETPANISFISAYLDDPHELVRFAAADALVQSVVDRPSEEAQPAIAAIEERLKREVLQPTRGEFWTRLAELPLPAETAVKYEREWIDEIQHLRPLRFAAIEALLRLMRGNPGRHLLSSTEAAILGWLEAGLLQGSPAGMVGTVTRGPTIDFLRMAIAMRADNDDIAVRAATFTCRAGPPGCGADIRAMGTRALNPNNPSHQDALLYGARSRLDLLTASVAVRKLIATPWMSLCTLLDISEGLAARADVISALAKTDPSRYQTCSDWDPGLYLFDEAFNLIRATQGSSWLWPTKALEALVERIVAESNDGPLSKRSAEHRESLRDFLPNVVAKHVRWQVRTAAARVATRLEDRALLTLLLDDPHPNVVAAALTGLVKLESDNRWDAAVEALEHLNPHLTIVATGALEGVPDKARVREPLFSTLERLTKAGADTSRRARLALLDRIGKVLGAEQPDLQIWVNRLQAYVTDFDPKIAESAATLIETLTGATTRARPTRRPALQPNRAQLLAIPACMSFATSTGRWTVRFDRRRAPVAIARLVIEASSGFYNDTVIHRADEDIAIGGSPAGNDEGGLFRFIRDEVGVLAQGHRLVLLGQDRDVLDGRLAFRTSENSSRHRRETVVGEMIEFTEPHEGVAIGRVSFGPRNPADGPCMPIGIPPIVPVIPNRR